MSLNYPVGKKLLDSAARTATTTTDAQTNGDHCGVHVIVDVTAVAATPSVTPTIEAFDSASGTWYSLLVGTAITGTGKTVLKVAPGITPVANGAAADYLPAVWRVTFTHADADSITYSVGANLLR